MAQTRKEKFERLVSTLDEVEIETCIVYLEAKKAGDSNTTALRKACLFLSSHPGREEQAFNVFNASLGSLVGSE